jgi:RING finger protein 113A
MHDRGDYKTGWQLDREWEEQQKQKREEEMNKFLVQEAEEEEVEEDDDLPFACLICRGEFKEPVVTK